jgi:hypothetical protein
MKAALFACVMAAIMAAPIVAADVNDLKGTWSGNWMPKGGVPDSVTVEIRLDEKGKLGGKFLTPAPMEFSKITFIPKTGIVSMEAADEKATKHYKIDGKMEGTEIKGTLDANGAVGEVRLIKWTYFGR